MGVPDYVPGPYRKRRDRNRSVSADMAMEKIILTSPAVYFNILRNMDFFTVDRLGVNPIFYEIPVQMATGVCPVEIVARARKAYKGYSFYAALNFLFCC